VKSASLSYIGEATVERASYTAPRNSSSLDFDKLLDQSSAKLEKNNILPWDSVQANLLNVANLKFDFSSQKVEDDLNKYQAEKTEEKKETPPRKIPEKLESKTLPLKEEVVVLSPNDLQTLLAKNKISPGYFETLMNRTENIAFKEGQFSKMDVEFLVSQIVEKAKLIKAGGRTELDLTLKPEHLGKVLLSLVSEDGIISIRLTASENTKEIIEAHLAELKQSLTNSNLNIGDLQVSVGEDREFKSKDSEPQSVYVFQRVEPESLGSELPDGYLTARTLGWLPELQVYAKT
jgi:flagellar hook-length control protein FliK